MLGTEPGRDEQHRRSTGDVGGVPRSRLVHGVLTGIIEPAACPGLVLAYAWAGMDTTVNAIASAVSLFADHPDQWRLLRSDRSLLVSATNEVLRIEPPVQRFTRITTGQVDLGGEALAAERRETDRFDIRRNPLDHLSFGRGVHRCVGAGLAQEEIKAVLNALLDRVERFDVVDRVWRRNNALHGLELLTVLVA